jgi:hypothetical protein
VNALVTNVYNDSVSLIGIAGTTGQVLSELDLRPGKVNPADSGKAGGEYPFWVTITKAGVAYISSVRDREVEVVQVSGSQLKFVTRIPVTGNPNKMIVEKFNRIVWEGLKGSAPYPTQRSGIDLRQNRQQLLLRASTAANAGS